MAAVNPPWAIQARADHPARLFREMLASLRGQAGVIAAADMAVTQFGTPNMSVNVAAGKAVVDGTQSSAAQGSYLVYNDATVNLTIGAADATNPRNDLVVAQVRDAEYSGANNDWLLAVIQGTPAPSPVDPIVPANSLTLARVRVNAVASSILNANITDLRPLGVLLNQAVVPAAAAAAAAIGTSPLAARADHVHQGPFLFSTLSGALASYDFTGIPAGFKMIEVKWLLRDNSAIAGGAFCLTRVNNDSGANYHNQQGRWLAATAVAGEAIGVTNWNSAVTAGGGLAAGIMDAGVFRIYSYADAVSRKKMEGSIAQDDGDTTGKTILYQIGGTWKSTAAINRVTITPSQGTAFDANSWAQLWLHP